eukprot:1786906-Karenia_brevis.AAC.1
MRKQARQEFNLLPAAEQWAYVNDLNATARCNMARGKFEWLDADQLAGAAPTLHVDSRVVLHSLISRADLNGTVGECLAFLGEAGRWKVR